MKFVLLTFVLLAIYNVNARTCTCAQFVDEKCNAQENCVWNTRQAIGEVIKGNHGICRSQQWMDCRHNEKCVISGRHMVETDDAGSNNKRRNMVEADSSSLEADSATQIDIDYDWPYNCATNEYSMDVIDVRPYEFLAVKSSAFTVNDNVGSAQKHKFSFFSMSMMGKVIAVLVFCSLIAVGGYYKYKSNTKAFSLLHGNEGTEYATF